jgi:hypothetical protein
LGRQRPVPPLAPARGTTRQAARIEFAGFSLELTDRAAGALHPAPKSLFRPLGPQPRGDLPPVSRALEKGVGLLFRLPFHADHWRCVRHPRPVDREDLSADEIRERLALTVRWLSDAQDALPLGGVSAGYYLYDGWHPAYPETTGYIMQSFIEYGRRTGEEEMFSRARRMCRFLLDLQEPGEGWFPGGDLSAHRSPSVFNSGMILQGLVRFATHFADAAVLDAARRCADWICAQQDADGAWGRSNYRGLKRTYDAEVAAALADLYSATKVDRYRQTALRAAEWIEAQQTANGWYANCDNTESMNDRPLTHLIGYTTRGLLVCGRLLESTSCIDSASRCLAAIRERHPIHSGVLLDGRLDRNWRGTMGAACMTGIAQIAISHFLLHALRPDTRALDHARWSNAMIAQTQMVECRSAGLRGGIPASFPIWGSYERFGFNNWGQKYFMDSLMLDLDSRETPMPPPRQVRRFGAPGQDVETGDRSTRSGSPSPPGA